MSVGIVCSGFLVFPKPYELTVETFDIFWAVLQVYEKVTNRVTN